MKYEYGALEASADRGTLKNLEGKKPILVQHCPPQIPCGDKPRPLQ